MSTSEVEMIFTLRIGPPTVIGMINHQVYLEVGDYQFVVRSLKELGIGTQFYFIKVFYFF